MQGISLIGAAWGIAAANSDCGYGPQTFRQSPYFENLNNLALHWVKDLEHLDAIEKNQVLSTISSLNQQLGQEVQHALEQKHYICILGGDHSCGIGTWSGAKATYPEQSLGLIWVDAHLDAHTHQTSHSGNIHGMPVAALLGYGAPELTRLFTTSPKILPQHLIYIGIRSFEPEEAELVQNLGIQVYDMQAVKKKGIHLIMQQACAYLSEHTDHFGLSVDLDGLDPHDAPGVGTPEPEGINANEFCLSIQSLAKRYPNFIGLEVAEFNPKRDHNNLTASLIYQIINSTFS